MRVLRRQQNLTLQALARLSGLTYPTVASVETNKTLPSLKTLDAIAGALHIAVSDLVGLAERRLVQRRTARTEEQMRPKKADLGRENCRLAHFDRVKIVRVAAEAGQIVHVMGLQENVHEMCYVLSGRVQLRVGDSAYDLEPNDTVLFDGLLDHAYHQLQAGEFVTVHVPKDIRAFQRLLGVDSERPTQDLNG